MRRGSLFGPIVILLVGTMLLVHNFRPDIEIWRLFGQYWPLLLIFLGVMKLVQALTPPDPSQPARPLVSGGEVFWIVVLCLFGVGIYKGGHIQIDDVPWGDIFGQEYTYSENANQAVSETQPNITVNNSYGDITIEGADIQTIEVKADKRVHSNNENDAKRTADHQTVQISHDGSSYTVRSDAQSSGRNSVRTAMEIRVPKGAIIRVDGHRGDVKVRDVTGAVNITADRGNVELADIGASVHLDIRRGSLSAQRIKGGIELDGRGDDIQVTDVDGDVVIRGEYASAGFANVKKVLRYNSAHTDLEIQKLPGKMDLSISALNVTEPSGGLTLKTSSKDIRIEDFDGPIDITNRNAGVELTTKKTPTSTINVENKSGRIEVVLPSSAHFQVDGSAHSGDVFSDFSGVSTRHDNNNGTMTGSSGSGNNPLVKLYTTYGSINLRKQE